MTREEENEIIEDFQNGDNRRIKAIIRMSTDTVRNIARHYAEVFNVPYSALFYVGKTSVLTAAQDYCTESKTRFTAYATRDIIAGIRNFAKSQIPVTVKTQP